MNDKHCVYLKAVGMPSVLLYELSYLVDVASSVGFLESLITVNWRVHIHAQKDRLDSIIGTIYLHSILMYAVFVAFSPYTLAASQTYSPS